MRTPHNSIVVHVPCIVTLFIDFDALFFLTGDVDSNPYSLIWSEEINDNPNLDEAGRPGADQYCVVLSHRQGLYHKKCQDRLSQAICSKRKYM